MTVTTSRDIAAHIRRGNRVTVAAPMTADAATVRTWYGLPGEVDFVNVGDGDTPSVVVTARLMRQARRRDVDLLQTRLLRVAGARRHGAALIYERHGSAARNMTFRALHSSAGHLAAERVITRRRRTLLLSNSALGLADHQAHGIGLGPHGASAIVSAAEPVAQLRDLSALPLRVHMVHPNGRQADTINALLDLGTVELHLIGELPRRHSGPVRSIGDKHPLPASLLGRIANTPSVIEHGFVAPGELLDVLASTHVGLSLYPANERTRTPVKLLDALSAGCAAIVGDAPPTQVQMAGDAAMVAPSDDPDAVVAAVIALDKDRQRLHAMRVAALGRAAALSAARRVEETMAAHRALTGEDLEASV